MKKKKWLKYSLGGLLNGAVIVNMIAFFHAYKFTHFDEPAGSKTDVPTELSITEKIKTLLFGINNPRPVNEATPKTPYTNVTIKGEKSVDAWHIEVPNSKGTIVMFHGYGGEKSGMIDQAKIFNRLGYNTLLTDFMGSGKSEGNQTTIGFFESEQVKSCFEYIKSASELPIYLYGTSMGAVAIMKSLNEFDISPNGVIIECPFGTMYQTVCARFDNMGVPAFPMAGLLVFWGGLQNGFWAFGHNPEEYAKGITCPTLLLYGGKDPKVSLQETKDIFENLNGHKYLSIYENAEHESYLNDYAPEWTADVDLFLTRTNTFVANQKFIDQSTL